MLKSRLIFTLSLLLLIGGGVWLGLSPRERAVLRDSVSSDLEVSKDVSLPGPAVADAGVAPEVTLPALEELGGLEDSWSARYPAASVIEARVVATESGALRRQQLLKTTSKRIPWVVWEDKLERTADGDYRSVGTVAHMGNVFLVEADPEVISKEQLDEFVTEYGLYVERVSAVADYVCLGFEKVALGRIEDLVAAFKQRFPEAIAEFDTLSYPSATPNDWDASRMWGLDQIHARDAWQFEKGDKANDVVIAIIDTGMQRLHPDLVGNLFVNPGDASANRRDDDGNGLVDDTSGWDFVNNDSDPDDDDGHGTHVAGIVGAVGNNGTGAVGVNWGVKLLPLKAGFRENPDDPNTQAVLRTSAINDALAYVSSLKHAGINIVATNNSYGSDGSSASTRNEIAKHQQLGILFVAASGNDGSNLDASPESLTFPAGYTLDNIISVGNSNQEDTLAASSNYGIVSVDISAPGSNIYSTYPDNSYEFLSGTSMASPMVAGAVGLLAQAEPALTASQLKARLLSSGERVASQVGQTLTGRRLDLLAALRPDLSGHFVEVTNIRDALVLVDLGAEVVFETATDENSSVTASLFYGADVGDIEAVGNGEFRFVPKAEGQAKIRFSASLGGVTRTVQKTVIVGDASLVDQGLLHHYAFDGTGNVETDLAGNANGSIVGATRQQSAYGSSLGFDSISEQMTFDGSFSDVVTIAALVRVNTLNVSPHPRILNMPFYYLYFSSGDTAEYPDGNRQTLKFFSNYDDPNNDPLIPDFGVWNTPPRSVKNDEWYYVVGTYNSTSLTNTPSLYLNGEQQVVRLQQTPLGSMVKTGGVSYVGNSEAGDRAFDGLMADIRVYNRALSPVEVSQLGAALTQDRWDSVGIKSSSIVALGDVASFEIEDTGLSSGVLSSDWYFQRGANASVVSKSGKGAELSFESEGTYAVTAQVSDGVVTRVFQKQIDVFDGTIRAGQYLGSSANGGLAWLEVDDSLNSGTITVFDPESGFYRIREPVTISETGAFATGENSAGKITGVALRNFRVEVNGYDLLFNGELQAVPSSQSEFQGNFAGGGINAPGDSIRMQVLDDGRVFLWREGPFADLAFGSHDDLGRVALIAATGESVELTIDALTDSVRGTWGEQSVFLTAEGISSDAKMKAGAVGGFPSGAGAEGIYSEFLELGVSPRAELVQGGFSRLESVAAGARGPLAVLNVSGTALRVDNVADETALVKRLASAVESGSLDLGTRVVRGLRVQVPIDASHCGLAAFSVEGSEPLEVLVRGLGPSFSARGAKDPMVSIYELSDGEAVQLVPNDNWRDGARFTAEGESAQGAFRSLTLGFEDLELSQLPDEAKDAAQRVWLEPGDYLVVIKLSAGEAGSGLLEVFAL